MVAFTVVASGLASASAIARAFGGNYLSVFVNLPTVLVAILFIIAINLINLRGITESINLNVA